MKRNCVGEHIVWLGLIVIIALGTACGGSSTAPATAPASAFDVASEAEGEARSNETDAPTPTPTSEPLPTPTPVVESEAIADLVERVRDGVVAIDIEACDYSGVGSGFVIDDHLVVTSAHVITEAEEIVLKLGDYTTEPDIVKIDPDLDLAILWVDKPMTGWHFSFADEVRVGEEALVLGYPQTLDFTVNQGSVTAVDASDPNLTLPAIRIDALVNPGNSGGPVINRDGNVIGVAKGVRTDLVGVGYAVDGPTAKAAIESWPTDERHPPSVVCERRFVFDMGNVNMHAEHPDAEEVRQLFDAYIASINVGPPGQAWRLLSENFQRDLGTEESFIKGNETSTIYNFEVFSITDTADGLVAEASFVSEQEHWQGPNGWECTVWKLNYTLVPSPDKDLLVIDGAKHRPGSPGPCAKR